MSKSYSIWEKESFYKSRDLIIVGLGIVGLQSALHYKLSNPKADILILEKSILPIGASTRNAGFACFGSISELLDDINTIGEEFTLELVKKRWEGLKILRETIGDENLEFKQLGGYELFTVDQDEKLKIECRSKLKYCNNLIERSIGLNNTYCVSKNEFGFNQIDFIVKNKYEGQINTGKMFSTLQKKATQLGIQIHRGWECISYAYSSSGVLIKTNHDIELRADKLLIASNAFAKNLLPYEDIIPGRNQVLITKPISGIKFNSCFHFDRGYVYFRNYNDRLLIGGGRNIDPNEQTGEFGNTQNIQSYLRSIIKKVILPNQKIEEDFWWSGIIATGQSKEPIIKEIETNIFAAVRLGGMGVALGSLVGKKVAKLLQD